MVSYNDGYIFIICVVIALIGLLLGEIIALKNKLKEQTTAYLENLENARRAHSRYGELEKAHFDAIQMYENLIADKGDLEGQLKVAQDKLLSADGLLIDILPLLSPDNHPITRSMIMGYLKR